MQANNVNHAVKRVSSDEIKRNYTQITGREALERLLAGEEVFATTSESWKIIDGVLMVRDCAVSLKFDQSALDLYEFLDPKDNDWYVAPPFDARKEMLARPGEWVAKFFDEEDGEWHYVGFDVNTMSAVESKYLHHGVDYIFGKLVHKATTSEIDEAIPLDDADLAKLALLSKEDA